jgi:hypothetical protein
MQIPLPVIPGGDPGSMGGGGSVWIPDKHYVLSGMTEEPPCPPW